MIWGKSGASSVGWRASGAGALLLLLACAPEPPRNVIVITLDTTRADALGAYGQRHPTSPRIDAMAAEGVLFQQALSSAPSTLPSHATIFTGRHPYAHGVRSNVGYRLPDESVTLAEVMREHGRATHAEIAAPVLGRDRALDQGFDEYADPNSTRGVVGVIEGIATHGSGVRPAEEITEAGLAFLRENADRPFFLWLHYFDPHKPYDPPEEFRLPGLAPYHAEIRRADHHVGRVLDEVESLGLRDRTVVALTSDHGEGQGQHGETTHSFLVYDSTMRVPFVLWGPPQVPRGVQVLSLVRLIDLAPTLLDLMGLPPLETAQGTSLVPLFSRPTEGSGLIAYGESIESTASFGTSVLRFLREGHWKYIHKPQPELYHVAQDPREVHNLYGDETQERRVKRMRRKLEKLLAEASPPEGAAWSEPSAEQLDALRALGYVAGDAGGDGVGGEVDLDSLELVGPDPNERIADVDRLAAGWGQLQAGVYAEAREQFRAFLEVFPESRPAQRGLILALRELDDPEALVAALRRGIELEPTSLEYRFALGRELLELSDLDGAEAVLRESLTLDACADRSRVLLGEVLIRAGRPRERLAVLEEGVEVCDPGRPSLAVRNALAFVLATSPDDELRDGERALELALAAVEETGGEHPDYLDTLAAAYAELGRFDRAVEEQRRAVALLEGRTLPEGLLQVFRDHLTEFESGRPLRLD